MPAYRDKERNRWRYQYRRTINGRRIRSYKILPAAWSRAQAEEFARREDGRLYALATGIEKPKWTIADALNVYLEQRVPVLKARARNDIEFAFADFGEKHAGRPFEEIGDACSDYAAARLPQLAVNTVRNRIAYVRAAARFANRVKGIGSWDSIARIRPPSERDERNTYIRAGELATILRHARPEVRAVCWIAWYTGLRWISEILTLTPQSIIHQGNDRWLNIPDSKTGVPHMVYVHPAIVRELRFIPFKTKYQTINREWREARAKAGFKHVRMHDLRHSHASALLSLGATLGEVGAALNHKSAASTRRYAHLYPERLKAVVGRLGFAPKRRSAIGK